MAAIYWHRIDNLPEVSLKEIFIRNFRWAWRHPGVCTELCTHQKVPCTHQDGVVLTPSWCVHGTFWWVQSSVHTPGWRRMAWNDAMRFAKFRMQISQKNSGSETSGRLSILWHGYGYGTLWLCTFNKHGRSCCKHYFNTHNICMLSAMGNIAQG